MYRDTYVEINLKNLKSNIETIIEKYKEYKYRNPLHILISVQE